MCMHVCLCVCDFKKVKNKNQNPNENWLKFSLDMYRELRDALFLSFASEESLPQGFHFKIWR